MAYNPSCQAQDDVLSARVLKVTPDIRMVHVNTHTGVSHVLVNIQARGLFVVMGPLVIIPVSGNDRQSPPRPFFEI